MMEYLEKFSLRMCKGGILESFTLYTVCSQLKTCMFCAMAGTKEKCLVKQDKKLFYKNFQLVIVNQQCFCKFRPFKIKINVNENNYLKSCSAVAL